MALWQKLFGSNQADQGKLMDETIDETNKIINDYGDFMQRPSFPAPGCIADTKKLPYNKENIKKLSLSRLNSLMI